MAQVSARFEQVEQGLAKHAKTRRLTVYRLAYPSLFFVTVQTRLISFGLHVELELAFHNALILALSLQHVAARSSRAEMS